MYYHHSKTNQSSSYRLSNKVRLAQNGTLNGPTVKKLCIFELFRKYLKNTNSTRRYLQFASRTERPKNSLALCQAVRGAHIHTRRGTRKSYAFAARSQVRDAT